MKNKSITPTLHDNTNTNASLASDKPAVGRVFKLGPDVDLNNIVVATQCDSGSIPPAQKWSRAWLSAWIG